MECTNGILRANGGLLIFKVRDRNVEESSIDNVTVLQSALGKYVRFGTLKFPGAWAGMNESGLAIVSSTSHLVGEARGLLIPDGYKINEEVLRGYSHLTEAVDYVARRYHEVFGKNKIGANILLSDRHDAMVVEFGSGESSQENLGERQYLLRTNHFDLLTGLNVQEEFAHSSHVRYGKAKELLDKSKSLKDVIDLTRNHENGPSENSICRHGKGTRTFSAVIFELSEQLKIHYVLNSFPCEAEYKQMVI